MKTDYFDKKSLWEGTKSIIFPIPTRHPINQKHPFGAACANTCAVRAPRECHKGKQTKRSSIAAGGSNGARSEKTVSADNNAKRRCRSFNQYDIRALTMPLTHSVAALTN